MVIDLVDLAVDAKHGSLRLSFDVPANKPDAIAGVVALEAVSALEVGPLTRTGGGTRFVQDRLVVVAKRLRL